MNLSVLANSKEIKTKQIFQYGDKPVEYTLIQSKRRKTFEVTVDRNEIVIRSPFDKSIEEIEKILNDKIKWISQKQKEFQNEKLEIIKPYFNDNSTLPYLGRNYQLEIKYLKDRQEERIEFQDDKFVAYTDPENKEREVNKKILSLYTNWIEYKASQTFHEKVNKYGKIIDVKPKKIVIKNLKNRWGSVTKDKNINLNVNLMKAPEDIINYIVIHELCHFKIKGHSYRYWNYLKQFEPDYHDKIQWLKRNSNNLIS